MEVDLSLGALYILRNDLLLRLDRHVAILALNIVGGIRTLLPLLVRSDKDNTVLTRELMTSGAQFRFFEELLFFCIMGRRMGVGIGTRFPDSRLAVKRRITTAEIDILHRVAEVTGHTGSDDVSLHIKILRNPACRIVATEAVCRCLTFGFKERLEKTRPKNRVGISLSMHPICPHAVNVRMT